MQLPYELYVRFLITKGYVDYTKLNETLEELSLFPVTQETFDRHYSLVHDKVPTNISNQIANQRYEGNFLSWMGALDVKEIWLYEKKVPEAKYFSLVYDIHSDIKLKLTLNALLVKGCPAPDICQVLNMKFSYMLKPEHVLMYKKFFWDPSRMTRTAWRRFLVLTGGEERALLFSALTEPLDTVKAILDLPAKTSVPDALQYLLTKAYQKARHHLQLTTPESNKEARAWISQTMVLADKYEKHRTGDIEDFGKSVQMEFTFIESEFPSPDEMALAEVRLLQRGVEEKPAS